MRKENLIQEHPMRKPQISAFALGQRDALTLIRICQKNGGWTEEKRTRWTREHYAEWKHSAHEYPRDEDVPYYAGMVSVLQSYRSLPAAPSRYSDRENEGFTHKASRLDDTCPALPDTSGGLNKGRVVLEDMCFFVGLAGKMLLCAMLSLIAMGLLVFVAAVCFIVFLLDLSLIAATVIDAFGCIDD
jgi:hypothetical protein